MSSKKKKNFLDITHGKINRNQKNVAITSDLGTPEFENHHILKVEYVDCDGEITEASKGRKRARNITQSTLDYCKAYGLINDEQYLAGCWLYADCYYAGLTSKPVQMDWSFIPKGNSYFLRELGCGRADCQRRYSYISRKLSKRFIVRRRDILKNGEPQKTNITYWDVAYQVCIEEIAIDSLEKWTDWPRRSGKKLIALVLDEVFDLYEGMGRRAKK